MIPLGHNLVGRSLIPCQAKFDFTPTSSKSEVAPILNVVIFNKLKCHFATTKSLPITHEERYGLVRLLIDLARAEIDQNSKESKEIS